MDSEDVREDKDDEREKEKPLVGDLNDGGYEYIAYDDTGCQEGIKEKKAPSPLLDFGEECEVESQKLQDDRIGGEKDAAKTEKEDSASSSSEDEAENVKNPIPGNVASDSDSEVEQEEKTPLERKASSCYSSSDEEGKVNKNDEDSEVDSEDEMAGKRQVQDELNDSLIKKGGEEDGQSSDDEVEKEVSVEKENFSHDAAFSPDVPAAVAQEVDFEGKYQRFLQNEEEMEEREYTSMTTGEEENKKEEKEDEADFCLMSDKPQEAMSAVPTTEVVSKDKHHKSEFKV